MANATYNLGSRPVIRVEQCSGDLDIRGHDDDVALISADSMPSLLQHEQELVIQRCDEDLRLRVPRGATVVLGDVDGDAQVEGLESFSLDHVAGDLRVGSIQAHCELQDVDGDLEARQVESISVRSVSGDASLDQTAGAVSIGRVAGDADIRGGVFVGGQLRVAGDLSMDCDFAESCRVRVDGDASLRLPEYADVFVTATVDGDVSGLEESGLPRTYIGTWGQGSARLELSVAGDLDVEASGRRRAVPSAPVARPQPAAAPAPQPVPQPAPSPRSTDPELDVLERVARGEISPEEAEKLLGSV